MVVRWIAILALCAAACAPRVDGPAARQRAHDQADGDRLGAQLAALPGVVRTEVVLRREVRDPLATTPPSPSMLSMVVLVDDRADRAAITAHAAQLARALAPELVPTLVVEVGAIRPTLAKVGPFTVEARSRKSIKVTLAIALALIAALAAWIAAQEYRVLVRYRRGA